MNGQVRSHRLYLVIAILGLGLLLSCIQPAGAQTAGGTLKVLPDRMRGVNVVVGEGNVSEDYLDTIKRWASWNINTIRIQLGTDNNTESVGPPPPTPTDPLAPYANSLQYMDRVVAEAGKYGIKVIVNLIAYGSLAASYWDPKLGKPFRDDASLIWSALATHYRDNPTVVAYDLFNEPSTTQGDYDEYNKEMIPQMVAAVRAVDPTTYLVLEPISYADFQPNSTYPNNPPSGLPVPADPHTIYSLHFYDPNSFTTQNGTTIPKHSHHYPGMNFDALTSATVPTIYWDKSQLRTRLQAALRFQTAHPGIRMYVGEFGVLRYADDGELAQWLSDAISLFEEYGWDWTFHDPANYNGYNPTFNEGDTDLGAPYGDLMTDRLQALLSGWALNTPKMAAYGSLPLPHRVDGTYSTDFSGAGGPGPTGAGGPQPPLPPAWVQVAAPGQSQTSQADLSGVVSDRLVHQLPVAAPNQNPSDLMYSRATYDFAASTLFLQASLDPGTSPGSASHVAIRDSMNDQVDLFLQQDGRLGYQIQDGSYNSGVVLAGPFSSAAATVRADISAGGVTIYRNGAIIATVNHSFAHQSGYSLELRGTSTQAASLDGTPVLIYANSVTVSKVAADLSQGNPTMARVTRLAVFRRPGQVEFGWRLAGRVTGVIGFDMYAGTHRLNRHLLPRHLARSYHFVSPWHGSGPFSLHLVPVNGPDMVVSAP